MGEIFSTVEGLFGSQPEEGEDDEGKQNESGLGAFYDNFKRAAETSA